MTYFDCSAHTCNTNSLLAGNFSSRNIKRKKISQQHKRRKIYINHISEQRMYLRQLKLIKINTLCELLCQKLYGFLQDTNVHNIQSAGEQAL